MEQLQAISQQQQQKQFIEVQLKMIDHMTRKMFGKTISADILQTSSTEALENVISEFYFDSDSGSNFYIWFRKYEYMFAKDFQNFDDHKKIRLSLHKLGTAEHERFINYILPKLPLQIKFKEAVTTLKECFGKQASLFSICYACLNIHKKPTDDYITYAGIVNKECESFQLGKMTEYQFKCLLFVSGLQSSSDPDMRTRLLNKIKQEPELKIQTLTRVLSSKQSKIRRCHD